MNMAKRPLADKGNTPESRPVPGPSPRPESGTNRQPARLTCCYRSSSAQEAVGPAP
jgi:hypothetical protein